MNLIVLLIAVQNNPEAAIVKVWVGAGQVVAGVLRQIADRAFRQILGAGADRFAGVRA
ncbi:MAG: hypothetical protein ABIK43_01250 [candidate division WOR-3 bacterium]